MPFTFSWYGVKNEPHIYIPKTMLAFEGFLLVLKGNSPEFQVCRLPAHLPRLAWSCLAQLPIACIPGLLVASLA